MQIERRVALDPAEFLDCYLRPGKPVVVTDGIETWSGAGNVLSESSLLDAFADADVQVYDDLFNLAEVCPLRQYLDGYWYERADTAVVPYVRWYAKFHEMEFCWADAAFEALAPHWSTPYFLPSSNYELPRCLPPDSIDAARRAFPARGIFIAAAGARTRLHIDPWRSDAVLCQLSGIKRLLMYAPAAPDHSCHDGAAADAALPSLPHRADIEDLLHPGETLYIPTGWAHHVVSLTNSISLTWNFVHAARAAEFRSYREAGLSPFDAQVLRYFGVES